MGIPYETATSGAAARDETVRLLIGMGAVAIDALRNSGLGLFIDRRQQLLEAA